MEEKLIKVRALTPLYYDEKYHRAGDVLMVPESYFDKKSAEAHARIMERVADDVPEHITSSNAAIAQEKLETLASRTQPGLAAQDPPTGAADVLASGKK